MGVPLLYTQTVRASLRATCNAGPALRQFRLVACVLYGRKDLYGYRLSKIATLFNVWPLASLPVVATIIVFRSSEMTRW